MLARPPRGALRINPSGDLSQAPSTMCFVMQKQVSLSWSLYGEKRNPRLRTRNSGGYLCRLPGCFPQPQAAGHQIRIIRSSAQSELIPNTHSPPTPGFVTCEPCGVAPSPASHHTPIPCVLFLFRGRDDVPSGLDAVMLDLVDGTAPVVAWCGLGVGCMSFFMYGSGPWGIEVPRPRNRVLGSYIPALVSCIV